MVYECFVVDQDPGRCYQGHMNNACNKPLLPMPSYYITYFGRMWTDSGYVQGLCPGDTWASKPGGCCDWEPARQACLAEARRYWSHFCDPPRAQYPIVDIGNFPTTPTPYTIEIAREPSTAALPEYYLDRGFAIATRIVPTSKCFPYIVFHYAYNQAPGKKTIVEIRKNNPATSFPMGIPGDGNILGKITVEFATDFHSYAVPINTILDEIDVPVWIVLYSEDYACSSAYIGPANRRVNFFKSDVGTNNVAVFSQANNCTWAMDNSLKNISLATYKASACKGTVAVTDYAFAKIGEPSIYLNDNCFVRLAEVEGANVAVGVNYFNPDPVRAWKRVRFSFAYRKPDLRYFTGIADLFDVFPGQHETFFDMNDPYFPGNYDELLVSAEVIQV